MATPCEFQVEVQSPASAVAFWDAFVSTVGRIVVPVTGQTALEDGSEVSSSECHAHFLEDCAGELLRDERMVTPAFSVAGWPDIRPGVRGVYEKLNGMQPDSRFYASLPLAPKPLTVPAPLFRVQTRPDRDVLTHLAGVEIAVGPESATALISIERWLMTEAIAPFGLDADGVLRLITDIDDACRDLSRRAAGASATYGVRPPTTNMIPAIEEALKKMMAG